MAALSAWARERADVQAVALVGSWARGSPRPDSDVDIVILTSNPSRYLKRDDWTHGLGIESFIGTTAWGVLTERRALTIEGLEVEFGFAPLSWAKADPPDPGTMRIVRDGMRVVYDPTGLCAVLVAFANR